jgi:hypothetical protein
MIRLIPTLFGLTLFVAAGLLFSVQPMAARAVLPRLGGAPAVWTACMMFFQTALLIGYACAHAATRRLGTGGQAALQLGLLAAAFLAAPATFAPDGLSNLAAGSDPTVALIGWLARTVGLPLLAVATTAPLLQRWFAATRHDRSDDPYFLYAASNAGSLLSLLAYPLWVERRLSLGDQVRAWGLGLGGLVGLTALCAAATLASGRRSRPDVKEAASAEPTASWGEWWGWVALAAIPSSLMLGVTAYLTTDLAAVPLLWVAPLALYLASFILVFGRGGAVPDRWASRWLPLLVMVQAPVMAAGFVKWYLIPLHVLTFFTAAVVCHGELARRRPGAAGLTGFYLAVAVGGALGGAFNAVVAPLVFDRLAEYPAALIGSCLVLGVRTGRGLREHLGPRTWILPAAVGLLTAALCRDVGGVSQTALGAALTALAAGLAALAAARHRSRPVTFALTAGAVLAASGLAEAVDGRVLVRDRSFFGTLKVTAVGGGTVHRLFHGSTLHGQQDLDPARRREPQTYFVRNGPVGQIFAAFEARPGRDRARVAVAGVGAGSLACYARPGQRWTFFEIDPGVMRVATDPRYFTYLADGRAASLDLVLADGRLGIGRAPDRGFDLIVLDAFTSDAIPVHLVTREALALYRRKLDAGGLIVMNITNRYLDLAPVVALLARDAGMACRVRVDAEVSPAERQAGKRGSIWAVLAAHDGDLGGLADDPLWFAPDPTSGDRVWTDDFSNLFDHFRFHFGPTVGRSAGSRLPDARPGTSLE